MKIKKVWHLAISESRSRFSWFVYRASEYLLIVNRIHKENLFIYQEDNHSRIYLHLH